MEPGEIGTPAKADEDSAGSALNIGTTLTMSMELTSKSNLVRRLVFTVEHQIRSLSINKLRLLYPVISMLASRADFRVPKAASSRRTPSRATRAKNLRNLRNRGWP